MVKSTRPWRPGAGSARPRQAAARKEKETTMTINQPADTDAAPPDTATGKAGTPRRRIIILASVVLVLLAGVVAFAVTALSPPAAPAAHGTVRPLTGTGTGTLTLNLTTGAATADFTGHLSPLGAETGYDDLTFTLTGPEHVHLYGHEDLRGGQRRQAVLGNHREGDVHPHHRQRARKPTPSPAAPAASPEPAGRIPTRSAPWSSRPPLPARPAASPLLPTDRSATRPDRPGRAFAGRRWPQAGSETNPPGHPDQAGSAMTRPFTPHHPRGGASQVPYLAG